MASFRKTGRSGEHWFDYLGDTIFQTILCVFFFNFYAGNICSYVNPIFHQAYLMQPYFVARNFLHNLCADKYSKYNLSVHGRNVSK